jgi:hypothetical protein
MSEQELLNEVKVIRKDVQKIARPSVSSQISVGVIVGSVLGSAWMLRKQIRSRIKFLK